MQLEKIFTHNLFNMKKNLFYVGTVMLAAAMLACTGGKNKPQANADSTKNETVDTANTAASYLGTYKGTLPAADCPGIETQLTVNADSTYELLSHNINSKDTDQVCGVYHMLKGNVLQLVRPSSGELTYYKVKGNNSVILTDSLGNEPESETAALYVLKKQAK